MQVLTASLPANPNCVLFTADAETLFASGTHGDLLSKTVVLAAPMHSQSGLPILVGLGWRLFRDRKNQESYVGTLFFVFDGPATADDLDQLERCVLDSAGCFGEPSIERVPSNAIWTALWAGGRPHLVVEPDPDSKRWFARALLWDSRFEPPIMLTAIEAESDDLPAWPRVTPGPVTYSAADEEIEQMRLAFALHHALRILYNAGKPTADHTYFNELFPPDLIERLRLHQPARRMAKVDEARRFLPRVLGQHDKLAIVGLLFSVCFSDGPLDADHLRALRDAAHELGMTNEQVMQYVKRIW